MVACCPPVKSQVSADDGRIGRRFALAGAQVGCERDVAAVDPADAVTDGEGADQAGNSHAAAKRRKLMGRAELMGVSQGAVGIVTDDQRGASLGCTAIRGRPSPCRSDHVRQPCAGW